MTMTLTDDIHDFFNVQIPQVVAGAIRLYVSFGRAPKPLIERLPNEILSYIFLMACNKSSLVEELDPVTISHVCRRWRHAALSTGNIWTRVVLTFPNSSHQLARTIACLNRSSQCPLDILLDFRDPAWDWQEDEHRFGWQQMETILRILLVHVHRWRRFELLTDTWSPIFTFLWYTRHVKSAPMLEAIALSRCNAYFASKGESFRPTALRSPMPLFGSASLPRLKSVSLVGVHVDWSSSSLSHLSELELKYHASDVMPSLPEFKNILACCPDLHHLAIVGWGPVLEQNYPASSIPQATLDDQEIIHLPSLRRFSFGFIDTDYALSLLSLLEFPSLEEMSLEDISHTVNPVSSLDATPVLEWLSTSGGFPVRRLRLLSLFGIRSSRSSLTKFFHSCHSLARLSIHYSCDDVIRALDPNYSCVESGDIVGEHATPLSDILELHCEDMDINSIACTLKSRAEVTSITPLDRLSLDFVRHDTPSSPEIRNQLSKYSKKTLIVSSD